MATSFPTPLPAWAAAGLLNAAAPLATYYQDLLQYIENLGTDDEWRKLQVRFKNIASGAVSADDAIVTFDLTNITGGQLDSTWTTGDYTTCEAKFDTFFTSWLPSMPNYWRVSEYRWYKQKFNPLTESAPIAPAITPDRIATRSLTGSATSMAPAQTAITVTEKTVWPKHWGRFYLPGPDAGDTVAGGRIHVAAQTALVNAAGVLYSGLAGSDFQVVIPVTQVDKVPQRSLVTVSSVQVDDIIDVIRRRRPRNALSRLVKP